MNRSQRNDSGGRALPQLRGSRALYAIAPLVLVCAAVAYAQIDLGALFPFWNQDSPEEPDIREVVIGGVWDVTGNWAHEGNAGRHAARLAVDDFNGYLDILGADWRLYMAVEDGGASGPIAFEKIQSLHARGIRLLVGVAFSSHLSQAAGYIDSSDMLAVSCCSTAANLEIEDTIFRLMPNDNNQAPVVRSMIQNAGIEHLLLVTRGDTWGDGMRDAIVESYSGSTHDGFRYQAEAVDFSAEVSLLDQYVLELVERYGAEKVGVLFVGTDEFSLVIQQMVPYQNVDDVRWFATNTQASNQELLLDEETRRFAERVNLTAVRLVSDTNSIRDRIDEHFRATYDDTPSVYTYAAYDSVWLLGSAILDAGSDDPAVLSRALPYVATHTMGAVGHLELTAGGDRANAEYQILRVQDGAWAITGR